MAGARSRDPARAVIGCAGAGAGRGAGQLPAGGGGGGARGRGGAARHPGGGHRHQAAGVGPAQPHPVSTCCVAEPGCVLMHFLTACI